MSHSTSPTVGTSIDLTAGTSTNSSDDNDNADDNNSSDDNDNADDYGIEPPEILTALFTDPEQNDDYGIEPPEILTPQNSDPEQIDKEEEPWEGVVALPESQAEFINTFSPLRKAPDGIKWGIERVDVPEEAKRQVFKWVIYDIKTADYKGQPINAISIREAFVITFRHKYRYCNKCWYRFTGPHWEEMKEELGALSIMLQYCQ